MKDKFIHDVKLRLANIKAGVEASHKQKVEWERFNGDEQQKLINQQIAAGLQVADNKLFDVGFEIDQEVKKNQSEIAKILYPEFNSNLALERSRGEANREYSLSIIYKLESLEQFKKLYNDKMNEKNIDLCTWLIDAAELRYQSVADRMEIAEIKQRHVQELGLNEILIEREQLLDIQKQFNTTKGYFAVGIYKEFSEATSLEEHTRMLIQAGKMVA